MSVQSGVAAVRVNVGGVAVRGVDCAAVSVIFSIGVPMVSVPAVAPEPVGAYEEPAPHRHRRRYRTGR
ncbi:hypothetical protein AB0958_44780 [Streptomyces sp. NPDC006655]|uniref:hypothetical protein n=1 Tax=Streptomyces sp. NPDC006655 TaxID=3156898 RepID=UPI0034517DC3